MFIEELIDNKRSKSLYLGTQIEDIESFGLCNLSLHDITGNELCIVFYCGASYECIDLPAAGKFDLFE